MNKNQGQTSSSGSNDTDLKREITISVDPSSITEFNWIGRLLGWRRIKLENELILSIEKRTKKEEISLDGCINFASLRSGILGQVLLLSCSANRVGYKYIKTSIGMSLVVKINKIIAANIAEHINEAVNEFEKFSILSYPRDSMIERISRICGDVNKKYIAEKKHWDEQLDGESLVKLLYLLQFFPVDRIKLREHHEKYQLIRRSYFFDHVESNPLTIEQRLGVIRSNDRNMVLAAAGTGKTSVIVAKALDLIDRNLADPLEILILAYNKSAAEEVEVRMIDKAYKSCIDLDSKPKISTFHALGRMILREAGIPTYMSIFSEDEIKLKQWITNWLETYLSESIDNLVGFISLTPEPVNSFDFNSQIDYENYIRDNEFRTLNSERVRGYLELLIANFLYLNGVKYEYEAPYVSKRRIEIGFDYRPDFYLNEVGSYIEHFGVDRAGNTRPGINSVKYNEDISKKRALHIECDTNLIETFHYEWIEGVLTSNLEMKLLNLGVEFNPIPLDQILEKLRSEGRISLWSDLLKKALQAVRVERLNGDLVLKRLQKGKISKAKEFADLINALHDDYVSELGRQKAIDFDDMIIRAIHVLKDGRYIPKWKYILVDEFQDISAARMDFVQAIVECGPDPSLTVVGDDWQSIYRFSGGKLELTTRFEEMIGSYTSTSLQKTFRYNNSIANTAGQFIMENPEQYKKNIKTHDQVHDSQIYLLDDKFKLANGLFERTVEVLEEIRITDSAGSVAIIARYNYLLEEGRIQK